MKPTEFPEQTVIWAKNQPPLWWSLLSLWDIMQEFKPAEFMQLIQTLRQHASTCDRGDGFVDGPRHPVILNLMAMLATQCDGSGLPVSAVAVRRAIKGWNHGGMHVKVLQEVVKGLGLGVENECSTILFYAIEADRRRYFDRFRIEWEDAIKRFPDLLIDVEEMNKCFALGRYAAAVFHAVHADETALIEVGKFLKVKDPKSGWTATANRLEAILKMPHKQRSRFEQKHFTFLEQLHGTVGALKDSWRNKISHSQGKLTLLTVDFSDQVAEEIIIQSRGFVRRIATELPG